MEHLFNGYSSSPGRGVLECTLKLIEVDAKTSIAVGLIVHELVTNGMKYAFSDAREGRLRVSLARREGKIALEVADDGVEIPETLSSGEASGLGMSIVTMLVKQICGTLSRTSSGSGTAIGIRFWIRASPGPSTGQRNYRREEWARGAPSLTLRFEAGHTWRSMSEIYFYDGRFVHGDEPIVRLEDRGYQFGDGVYDAWMVHGGRQFLRGEHLDRFERSCAAVGIVPSYSRAEVEAFTDEMLGRSGFSRAMIYLQWTRGVQSPRAHAAVEGLRSILSGFIGEKPPYPGEYFSKGISTIFYPDERQRYCDIKSLNLLGSVMASNAARAAGCHETLFVREEGGRKFVTESAHSNCYAVKDGVVHTAPNGKLILPGVTRRVVLDLARDLGIGVVEEFQSPEFFSSADEAFISAASGILPIGTIEGRKVGSGERPVFTVLAAAYDELVAAGGD
jgi:D-alanine transaminase